MMYYLPIHSTIRLCGIILSFLHSSAIKKYRFPSQRQVNAGGSNVFNGRKDNSDGVIVTGIFDLESMSALSNIISRQQRRGRRSSGFFSFSLYLPDLSASSNNVNVKNNEENEENEEPFINYSFDCTEGNSNDQSSTKFYVCSNQQAQEQTGRSLLEQELYRKALFGINGPFITGVIESESIRVQIMSHIERDNHGNISNVTYRYAAAKPEDVFYEHVGLDVKREHTYEQIYLDDEKVFSNNNKMNAKESSFQNSNIFMDETDSHQHDIVVNSKRAYSGNDGSEVDLLIYYTKRGACQWLDDYAPYPCTLDSVSLSLLETYAESWVQYMNDVITRSDINDLRFVKVHVAIDPDYDESTDPEVSKIIGHLTDPSDGFMDEANILRDSYSADLIVGFAYNPTGAGGVAWVPRAFPSSYYGVSVSSGPFPFLSSTGVHEVGHNFGCNHHRSQYAKVDPANYNYGYADCSQAQCWTTIMSYTSVCRGICSNINEIPYFSNPDVNYNGIPTGTSESNNALQISKTKFGVAKNRYRGQKSISFFNGYYDYDTFETLFFDLRGKRDIILTNFEFYFYYGAREIEVSYLRSSYEGKELNDALWESIADEVISPLSDISADKLKPIGTFSSPFQIFVSVNEQVSIRIKILGGNIPISATSIDIGDTVIENDDISINAGRVGTSSDDISSFSATIFGSLIYSLGWNELTPSTKPSLEPSVVPTMTPFTEPSMSPSAEPSVSPSLKPSGHPSMPPSLTPSTQPSILPSLEPSLHPTKEPSQSPTVAPLCEENEDRVTISIKTDGRGADIYWFLKQFRASTKRYFNVAKSGKAKYGNNTLYTEEYCVKKNKCFKFIIKDTTNKDGLCCAFGSGFWRISLNGIRLKQRKMANVKRQQLDFGTCE